MGFKVGYRGDAPEKCEVRGELGFQGGDVWWGRLFVVFCPQRGSTKLIGCEVRDKKKKKSRTRQRDGRGS